MFLIRHWLLRSSPFGRGQFGCLIGCQFLPTGRFDHAVIARFLGSVTGYPGVFQGNPYPYPSKPVPVDAGTGFPWVTQGYYYHLLIIIITVHRVTTMTRADPSSKTRRGGHVPPHRVEMGMTRRGGLCPSLLHRKAMTQRGRAYPSPTRRK